MVASVATRVERLLEATGGGGDGACLEYGGPHNFGPDDTYELVFIEPDGPEDREEWCETCGRQTEFVVRFPEDLS
jgi:hypothetical protein